MNETGKPAWHFWAIAIVAVLWNAGGIVSYLSTKLGMLDGMGMAPEQLAYFYGFPAWASAFWALGVWGAFLGSVALLMRRKWASMLYAISIVGLLGTTVYERLFADIPASMQTSGQLLFAVAIWVITIALFIYARRMSAAGILR